MNTKGMIEVTEVPLGALVAAAYDLSQPRGLGMLHFKPGSLTDEEVAAVVANGGGAVPVSMDYVKGRACKFTVYEREGRRFIRSSWYDHSDADLRDLLARVGIDGDALDKARQDAEAA